MKGRSADLSSASSSATLQSSLEADDPRGPPAIHPAADIPTISDPVSLFRHLEASGRFSRDRGFGRVYHPGRLSFREDVSTDSLHLVVEDNRLTAHVDRISPLGQRGRSRYSVRRAVAHNLVGMAQDVMRLVRGREGDHRCELNCEWLSDEAASLAEEAELLDPGASAWSVHLEARVAGALDPARLRAALVAALGSHDPEHDPLEVVECHHDDALDATRSRLQSMDVPVTARPPLHLVLASHPAGDVLMFNLNHAATDGFGAVRVLRAIARAYAGDAEPDAPLEFLALRDLPVRPTRVAAPLGVRYAKRAVEWLRDLLARSAGLACDDPGDDAGYGFHLVRLSSEETGRVIDVERPGTSRNVLMAALHLTIGDWNLRHGSPNRRIRVLTPANLRPPEWRDDPVGNLSVTARVSTTRRERASPAAALKAITAQTVRNKRTRTGIALIAALERTGLLPLWAKQSLVVLQPLTGNQMVDNAMLGNLGRLEDVPSFGDDVGEPVELWFSTPTRSPMSLCLGAVAVGGHLHLTFRYPHRVFGRDAARRFADSYLEHLRSVADRRR